MLWLPAMQGRAGVQQRAQPVPGFGGLMTGAAGGLVKVLGLKISYWLFVCSSPQLHIPIAFTTGRRSSSCQHGPSEESNDSSTPVLHLIGEIENHLCFALSQAGWDKVTNYCRFSACRASRGDLVKKNGTRGMRPNTGSKP